ncbi:carboxymuconolactone decarboxylase family protein [Actibacterium sp. 188UL27-1]|uniref:carboxymuconolactone decarboxylase family protein n=1 Tax=Actibacterium sp. 188UL27-1 TaxID=2786961 RepID=UPI00195E4062|nr:carboxymuconolactone decarboxylase family protein [Actibacterium sp. 188UL27-1]MBM7067745.1 carboxymuconolactone decarboxylase family protein [Actibacterium sp. 188UL27-1]
MSDDLSKFYAQMMAQGQEMAKALNPAFDPGKIPAMPNMADWMPTMPAELMEAFLGKGLSPDGLDAKTRLLVTLAALTVLGAQAEDQVRLTVRHAMVAGASPQEVAQVIAQMAPFGGVPAMTKAMELAQTEIEKQGEGSA